MEKKVLTSEEIQSILKLQKIQAKLVEDFGLAEYQIQSLTQQKQELVNELNLYKQQEIQLGKTLQEKYGDGTIDLEKGEFISST
jgi:Zn-dependent oligopeptidase